MKRGVVDADAEPETLHLGRVGVLGDLLDDEASPGVGACVGGGKGLFVIASTPPPGDLSEIGDRRGSRST